MQAKKAVLPLLLVVAVTAIAYAWFSHRSAVEDSITVSGNIRMTEVDIAFKTPGKLTERLVDEGDTVQQGQVVARLDVVPLLRQKDKALAALAAAEARTAQSQAALVYLRESVAGSIAQREAELASTKALLRELERGSRPQEIQQAEAAVAAARAQSDETRQNLRRGQTLFETNDISAQDFDRIKGAADSATAALQQSQERLALVREGPRREQIESAQAQTERARGALRSAKAGELDLKRQQQDIVARLAEAEAARADLASIEVQLADAVAVSPVDGIVMVKSAEPGEILAAGTTVLTIGDIEHPWMRAYINQVYQGRVRLDTPVRVTTDSFLDKAYQGRVSFMAADAEFTPKEIQTEEERVKLVYRLKIDLLNPNQELKRNMPAVAVIPLTKSASGEPGS
jgi:HlyD family secretion protein